MIDGFMADGLVGVECRRGSGVAAGVLGVGALGHGRYQWRRARCFQRY